MWSPPRLHAACGGDAPAWLAKQPLNLLLTHHPPTWLEKLRYKEHWRSEIAPPGRFAVHLHGHLHEPGPMAVSEGGSAPRHRLQGASLFGLERFVDSAGERLQRVHGYSTGRVELVGAATAAGAASAAGAGAASVAGPGAVTAPGAGAATVAGAGAATAAVAGDRLTVRVHPSQEPSALGVSLRTVAAPRQQCTELGPCPRPDKERQRTLRDSLQDLAAWSRGGKDLGHRNPQPPRPERWPRHASCVE